MERMFLNPIRGDTRLPYFGEVRVSGQGVPCFWWTLVCYTVEVPWKRLDW